MDGENLSSLQIETGIREWLLEMDLENSRKVVKKQVPEVPLYQLLYEQKTYLPCGGIRLAWGHFMLLFWTLALKKKWGISVKLVHLVQSVEWQGGFIMCPWTRSQKYVFHWPGRSEEVLWLRSEQSGHSSDPHGLMTENPVRISLSLWLTLCTTSHPPQNLNNIENTFHGPWNLCSLLGRGWRRTWIDEFSYLPAVHMSVLASATVTIWWHLQQFSALSPGENNFLSIMWPSPL